MVTKLCHVLDGDPSLQMFLRNVGVPSQKIFGCSKTSKCWRDFRKPRGFITNISGLQQTIITRKTVQQTTITFPYITLVNLVNFGLQTESRTKVSTHPKSHFHGRGNECQGCQSTVDTHRIMNGYEGVSLTP